MLTSEEEAAVRGLSNETIAQNEIDNTGTTTLYVEPVLEEVECIADVEECGDFFQKVVSLFRLQASLNFTTNGEVWLEGYTKENRVIDWVAAFKGELFESLDCFPWKHWANIDGHVNVSNLRMEIVDSIHFGMSILIDNYYKSLKIRDLNYLQNHIMLTTTYTPVDRLTYNSKIDEVIEGLVTKESIKTLRSEVDILLQGFYNEVTDTKSRIVMLLKQLSFYTYDTDNLLVRFLALCVILGKEYKGFNFNSLYKLYIGKHMLNKFRQDNGYKTQEYTKLWGDVEDNVYLLEIVDSKEDITGDYVYSELERLYKQFKPTSEPA